MELKEVAYKKTEIGFIPEEWIIAQMKEVGNVDPENLNSKTSPNYELKYVSLEDVNRGVLKGYSELKFQDAPSRARRVLRKNDVVFGTVRPNLKSHFYVDEEVKDLIGSTGFAVIRPHDAYNGRLIFEHLFSGNIDRQLNAILVGSNYPAVNSKEVKSLRIPLPPTLEEQKAIATALSDVDTLITNLDKLIAKKKAIKQGAMQRLLKSPAQGGQRLQGFEGEWRGKSLFELANKSKDRFNDGDWIEAKFIEADGIRLVQTGNIGTGSFIEKDSKKFISEQSFSLLSCKEILPGDLLISRLAEPAGRACIFPKIDSERSITSVDVTIFRPNESIVSPEFLNQIFTTNEWLNAVRDNVGGTTHKRISRSALGSLQVFLPPTLDEQKTIASILSDMDKEIESLESKKSKYLRIKQGMMQELLTGKTRLV